MKGRRTRNGAIRLERRLKRQQFVSTVTEQIEEQQAANRRKLLDSLSPSAREFAVREFAKLGLHQ